MSWLLDPAQTCRVPPTSGRIGAVFIPVTQREASLRRPRSRIGVIDQVESWIVGAGSCVRHGRVVVDSGSPPSKPASPPPVVRDAHKAKEAKRSYRKLGKRPKVDDSWEEKARGISLQRATNAAQALSMFLRPQLLAVAATLRHSNNASRKQNS